jgi:hypothetical protein
MRLQAIVYPECDKRGQWRRLLGAVQQMSREDHHGGDKVLLVGRWDKNILLTERMDFPAFQRNIMERFGVHVYTGLSDFRIEKMMYGGRDITEIGLRKLMLDAPHVLSRDVDLNGSAKGDPVPRIMKHILILLKSGGVKKYLEGNGYLFENVIIEDPEDILTIRYGCPDIIADVTDYIISQLRRIKRFDLPAHLDLNSLAGDPKPNVVKTLELDYVLINNDGTEHHHREILPEERHMDLCLNVDMDYIDTASFYDSDHHGNEVKEMEDLFPFEKLIRE